MCSLLPQTGSLTFCQTVPCHSSGTGQKVEDKYKKKISKKNIQITCFCLVKHCPLRSHKSQLHRFLKEDIEDRSGDGKLFELT